MYCQYKHISMISKWLKDVESEQIEKRLPGIFWPFVLRVGFKTVGQDIQGDHVQSVSIFFNLVQSCSIPFLRLLRAVVLEYVSFLNLWTQKGSLPCEKWVAPPARRLPSVQSRRPRRESPTKQRGCHESFTTSHFKPSLLPLYWVIFEGHTIVFR